MKLMKIIGLVTLICFTFFYTEKIIDVTTNQDDIMIKIRDVEDDHYEEAINAKISDDTIIPGNKGRMINVDASYKFMKKLGYFDESLLIYEDIYPDVSIYNNYNLYIVKGNTKNKNISLIYILNNDKTIDNFISILNRYKAKINFFIDSDYLLNNISVINKIKDYEIYNYGVGGKYSKDSLIVANNIINNKANNKSMYCLFLDRDIDSLNNCANSKMLSILAVKGTYNNVINNLSNGNIFVIESSSDLKNILEYIKNSNYKIVSLSELLVE